MILLSLLVFSLNFLIFIKMVRSTNFDLVTNKELNSIGLKDSYLNFSTKSLFNCLIPCNQNNDCVLALFKSNECNLFKLIRIQYFIDSDYNCLYKKRNNK